MSYKQGRIVAPNIQYRFVAILCCVVVVWALWLSSPDDSVGARFLVQPVLMTLPEDDPTGGRELSEYSFAGYFEECTYSQPQKKCLALREQARKFVDESLRSKRKSYLIVDFFCVDCAPVYHVFVEPDEEGVWHITIRRGRERVFSGYEILASDLKRRRATKDELLRSETSFSVLAFVDGDGKEVFSF